VGALGVVLAGGAGTRLGGAKALAPLGGEPLLAWPLRALREAVGEAVVVAKRSSPLPPGVEAWFEPGEPRHPLTGVVHALERAEGRAVLVVAVDLPLVTPAFLRELAGREAGGAAAVVAAAAGRPQPLCARYEPAAREPLAAALPDGRVLDAVLALRPVLVEAPDAALLANVNTPDDLARANRRWRSSCGRAGRSPGRRRGA
jgi:molybdopterin-guanine dinucleotide biosynthesis protein A